MIKIHKRLLEAFEKTYTTEDILSVISEIKDKSTNDEVEINQDLPVDTHNVVTTSTEVKSVAIPDAIIEFVKYLEGVVIRLKELHWNTENNAEHYLISDLIETTTMFEDNFVESCMGITGERIKTGDITPKIPDDIVLKDVIEELTDTVLTMRASIDCDCCDKECNINKNEYFGIVSILDDYIQFLNKKQYQETLK